MNDIDISPDVLVLGGGVAGAVAAARAKELGARVVVVRRAGGGSAVSSGAIDVADALHDTVPSFDADPRERGVRVRRAMDFVAAHAPAHPYALLGEGGRDRVRESLAMLRELCRPLELVERDDGYNHVVASEAGTLRRCAVVQKTQLMDLAALDDKAIVAIVQPMDLANFDAKPVAHVLSWVTGFSKNPLNIVVVQVPRVQDSVFHAPLDFALAMDGPAYRTAFIDELKAQLRVSTRVPTHLLFPACLGVSRPWDNILELEKATGKVCRELLGMHRSVPGERLSRALVAGLRRRGVVQVDAQAVSSVERDGRITRVMIEGHRVKFDIEPKAIVLATGRFFAGGIVKNQVAQEPVFGLPVMVDGSPLADRFVGDMLGPTPEAQHALFRAGVRIDARCRPLDAHSVVVRSNVFCAGAVVGGFDPTRDGTAAGTSALLGWWSADGAYAASRQVTTTPGFGVPATALT